MGYELRLREPQSLARLRFPWGKHLHHFRASSVRPKINFLVVAWEDVFLFVWRLLVSNGGYPPLPWPVFWNQYFSLVLPPGI
jgi:hypothetical protein